MPLLQGVVGIGVEVSTIIEGIISEEIIESLLTSCIQTYGIVCGFIPVDSPLYLSTCMIAGFYDPNFVRGSRQLTNLEKKEKITNLIENINTNMKGDIISQEELSSRVSSNDLIRQKNISDALESGNPDVEQFEEGSIVSSSGSSISITQYDERPAIHRCL